MTRTTIERLRPRPAEPEPSWSAATLSSIVQGESPGVSRTPHPESILRPRRGRRWYVPGAAVAALLAAVFVVHSLWPTPAYAVTGRNDAVEVRITRLEGADGLEQALGKHGIKADITYLAAGQQCAPGRYTDVPSPDLIVAVNADSFLVLIPEDTVDTDDTLVLAAFVARVPGGFQADVDAGIARGAVAPCAVVPAR